MHDLSMEGPLKVVEEPTPAPSYLDFKIVEQVLKLCKLTTETINHYKIVRNSELECGLLNFVITYKNKVLTDDLMFYLGENLMKKSEEECCKALRDFFTNQDAEFKHQYHMLA